MYVYVMQFTEIHSEYKCYYIILGVGCGAIAPLFPLLILLQYHTDVAEKAFNLCVGTNEGKDYEDVTARGAIYPTSDAYGVVFDYRYIEGW